MNRIIRQLAALTLGCLVCTTGLAQSDWPTKPLRVLTPSPPGTTSDTLTRVVLTPVAKSLGTQLIVEYKPGVAGTLAQEGAAKAAPDGYTYSLSSLGSAGIAPTLYQGKLRYDSLKDMVGVARLVSGSNVLVVAKNVPVNSLSELIAYSKANPDKLNVGHLAGYGTSFHMAWVKLATITGLKATDIPLKGPAEAVQGVLSGEIHVAMSPLATFLSYVRDNRVRAIAVTPATRDPALPDTPTMMEAGVQDYDVSSWFGISTNSATPRAIVDRMSSEILKALDDPTVSKSVQNQGFNLYPLAAQEYDKFIHDEVARWEPVVKASGFTIK